MSIVNEQGSKDTNDLKHIRKSYRNPDIMNKNSNQKVSKVLKTMENQLSQKISKGQFQISKQNLSIQFSEARSLSSSRQSKSKQKRQFYLASNPEKIQQKYEKFKTLKQQYSHQKTSEVVKQMEPRIKSWINRQKKSQQKRQNFLKKKQEQQKKSLEKEFQQKRKSTQAKSVEHKQKILEKIKERQQKKKQTKQKMNEESFSKIMLQSQVKPLFVQRQKQFEQKQRQEEMMKRMELQWKKKSLIPFSSESIKQHQRRYMQQFKHKLQSREDSPRKMKTQSSSNLQRTRSQFITTRNDRLMIQHEEEKKKIRIKEYIQRLKSMSPDQTTLQRIKKVKQEIMSNEKLMKQKKKQREIRNARNRSFSLKNITAQNSSQIVVNRNKLGNQYLKDQAKYKKIKTQIKADKISQKGDQSSSMNPQTFKIKVSEQKTQQFFIEQNEKAKPKQKFDILEKFQHQEKVQKEPQQRKLKRQKHEAALPAIQKKSKSLRNLDVKPVYKNYLADLKLKKVQNLNQLDKLKRDLKYPAQILKQFNRRSYEIQKKMMKKINEYKHLRNDKYDKNLKRETQIDELFHKNLQVKLAALNID